MRWFHFVFDPTDDSDGPTPGAFLEGQPFQVTDVKSIEQILVNLSTGSDALLEGGDDLRHRRLEGPAVPTPSRRALSALGLYAQGSSTWPTRQSTYPTARLAPPHNRWSASMSTLASRWGRRCRRLRRTPRPVFSSTTPGGPITATSWTHASKPGWRSNDDLVGPSGPAAPFGVARSRRME